MQLPGLPRLTGGIPGLSSLAAFIRERLGEVAPLAGSLFARRDDSAATPAGRDPAVRRAATVIVAASAPFASSSYARARLLRQMHASGMLSRRETEQAEQLFGVAQ